MPDVFCVGGKTSSHCCMVFVIQWNSIKLYHLPLWGQMAGGLTKGDDRPLARKRKYFDYFYNCGYVMTGCSGCP